MKRLLSAAALLILLALSASAHAKFEAYVENVPAPAEVKPETAEVQAELETLVDQIVKGGTWAPSAFYSGFGGSGVIYYATPAEMIASLSASYPYLSSALKDRVKAYLAADIEQHPPHSTATYSSLVGATLGSLAGTRREYFAVNPDQSVNMWPPPTVHPVVLHAVWLYSHRLSTWTYATEHYADLKPLYDSIKTGGGAKTYADLAAIIGFARIARQIGKTEDYADALALAETSFGKAQDYAAFAAEAAAQHFATLDPHMYPEATFFASVRPLVLLYFAPDVGRFLRDEVLPAARAHAEKLGKDIPLWWLTAPGMSHGENLYALPHISFTGMMLRSYVLGEPTASLLGYLDTPERKADLYHVQKLVAVIENYNPTGSPVDGGVDAGDGTGGTGAGDASTLPDGAPNTGGSGAAAAPASGKSDGGCGCRIGAVGQRDSRALWFAVLVIGASFRRRIKGGTASVAAPPPMV
jgi:hypothetical protein